MKKVVLCFLLVCVMASFAAVTVSAEFKPNPIVQSSNLWFPSNMYIRFGNNSSAVSNEGTIVKPFYEGGNIFSKVYFNLDQPNKDPYVAAGYYDTGYSVILLDNGNNGFYDTGSFYDSPNVYMTDYEERFLQPGGVIEFYVSVGNVNLKDYTNKVHYYNRIGGVEVGNCTYDPVVGPISWSSISDVNTEILTFNALHLSADASSARLVQLVRIKNNSNQKISFTGIRLSFMYTDSVGNPIRYVQTGYKSVYIALAISAVCTYNETSRSEDYLGNIDGEIGSIGNKIDSWFDANWNSQFQVNFPTSVDELELDALQKADDFFERFGDQLQSTNVIDSVDFWQSVFGSLYDTIEVLTVMTGFVCTFLILRALIGR